jgi:acylphosphatase
MRHVSIRVYGKVQGVFFRASTKEKANELTINGCVGNEDDGSVAIEAEGDDVAIDKFLEWCKKGPRLAVVTRCEVKEAEIQNFKGFFISR